MSDAGKNSNSEKTKRRRVLRRCGWLGLGILLLLILFFICRDFVIRQAVEKSGSYFLGVPVLLEDFSSSVFGKVEIRNLRIGNPSGYQEPDAMSVKLIRIRVNMDSLFSDMIEIEEITVQGLHVNYEPGLKSSNLTDLQKNIEKQCGANDEKTAKTAETKPQESGKAVLIRQLNTSDSRVSLSNSAISLTQSIALPDMHLKDIGGRNRSWQNVMSELYGVLLGSITNVSGQFGSNIASGMKEMLSSGSRFVDESGKILPGTKEITEGTGRVFEESKKIVKDVWSGGEKIVSGSTGKLKNLFQSSEPEKK